MQNNNWDLTLYVSMGVMTCCSFDKKLHTTHDIYSLSLHCYYMTASVIGIDRTSQNDCHEGSVLRNQPPVSQWIT